MNSVKVYRLKLFYRYYIPVLFGLAVLGPALQTGRPFPWNMFSPSRLSESWWFLLLLVLALATFALFLLYLWLVNWKVRLVLTENHLSFETIPNLAMKPFHCAYADVVRVERAEAGVLRVIPPQGQPLVIAPAVFEGKADELLAELHQRIGRAKFEVVSARHLNRKTRWDKVQYAFVLVYLIIGLSYFYINLFHPMVLKNVAWRSFGTVPSGNQIEALTIGANSEAWVYLRDILGKSYSIQRITAADKTSWELDFVDQGSDLDEPRAIAFSEVGYPTVVLGNGQVRRWDGQTWQILTLPVMPERTFSPQLATNGSRIWLISEAQPDQPVLIEVDANSGQAYELNMPPLVANGGWSFDILGRTTSQTLLARVRREDMVRFFLWENTQWQEVGAELEQRGFSEHISGISPSGQLWTISSEYSSANDTLVLWRYENDKQWHSYRTPAYRSTAEMQLDANGRLWVAHWEGLDVYEATSTGELKSIERYTEENSGYQFSYTTGLGQLTLDANGYLWGFDKGLARIDTNAPLLPAPLPDWAVTLTNGLIWGVLMAVVALLMLAFTFLRNNRLRKARA